jgi:hypothetical protein
MGHGRKDEAHVRKMRSGDGAGTDTVQLPGPCFPYGGAPVPVVRAGVHSGKPGQGTYGRGRDHTGGQVADFPKKRTPAKRRSLPGCRQGMSPGLRRAHPLFPEPAPVGTRSPGTVLPVPFSKSIPRGSIALKLDRIFVYFRACPASLGGGDRHHVPVRIFPLA